MSNDRGRRFHRVNNLNFTMAALNLFKTPISIIKKDTIANIWLRTFITGRPALNEDEGDNTKIDPRPKRESHPLSVCLDYMKSKAYKKTYGDKPVWHVYVRNFKGHIPPKTRNSCVVKSGAYRTNNPCPICRDCYLMPHYTNVELIKQFISPHGGHILDSRKTSVCQKQQENIVIAINQAWDTGKLIFHVPHRHYDYSLYNKK